LPGGQAGLSGLGGRSKQQGAAKRLVRARCSSRYRSEAANQTIENSAPAKIRYVIFLPAMRRSDALSGAGTTMHASESEFCRGQADRLRKLAEQCSDAGVRDHLYVMADEWLERAKAAEGPGKPDLPDIA